MQYLPISTYGCSACKLNNSEVQRLCVYFNNAFRSLFNYTVYESDRFMYFIVKTIKSLLFYIFSLNLLSIDAYFVRKNLY